MTDLKKELLRFKDIVAGMVAEVNKKADMYQEKCVNDEISYTDYAKKDNEIYQLKISARTGINAILELAEELEKDNGQ